MTFLHHVERGEEIVLYGDGAAVRDYLHAGDVARVIADLLGRDDPPAILNVGSGHGTSLAELVALVEREVGKPARFARGLSAASKSSGSCSTSSGSGSCWASSRPASGGNRPHPRLARKQDRTGGLSA